MAEYQGRPRGNSSGRQRYAESLPKGVFRHNLPETEVDKIIRETFCPVGRYAEYRNLRKLSEETKEGMTRICYLADWGVTVPQPGNGENESSRAQVIIKVDRAISDVQSPNARTNLEKGCDTSNDISSMIGARHANLACLRGFKVIPLKDEKRPLYVSVEQYVDGISLQRRVDCQPLTYAEFEEVFQQAITGLSCFINNMQRYHRDIKPSNIILGGEKLVEDGETVTSDVRRTGKGKLSHPQKLEVLLTDFSNSCKVTDAKLQRVGVPETSDSISGAHLITNPFLFGRFTGQPERYDDRSEIYSLGSCMYFALTGKYLFDCDRFKHTAVANVHGQQVDLLDEAGKIDTAKFREALDAGLRESGIKRKYANVIRKCFLAPLNEQSKSASARFIKTLVHGPSRGEYATIDDLARDFDSLTDDLPRKFKKAVVKTALPVGMSVASSLAIFAAGYATKVENQNIRLKNENAIIEQKLQAERNAKLQAEARTAELKRDIERVNAFVHETSREVTLRGENQMYRIEELTKLLDMVRREYLKDIRDLYETDMPEDLRAVSLENMQLLKKQADDLETILKTQKANLEDNLDVVKPKEQPQNGN